MQLFLNIATIAVWATTAGVTVYYMSTPRRRSWVSRFFIPEGISGRYGRDDGGNCL